MHNSCTGLCKAFALINTWKNIEWRTINSENIGIFEFFIFFMAQKMCRVLLRHTVDPKYVFFMSTETNLYFNVPPGSSSAGTSSIDIFFNI